MWDQTSNKIKRVDHGKDEEKEERYLDMTATFCNRVNLFE